MLPDMDRVAVVTGASRGIGRAVALCFAREGYAVRALARSQAELEQLASEASGRIEPFRVDLEHPGEVEEVCARLLEGAAPPSVLVNNAGIAVSASLARTPLETFERVMAINARAPFLLCQRLMPAMASAGFGRVVNVASTAAVKGFKYTSAYCASKHALLGLTRALAVEFARQNVTVNAVCPGWTDTAMLTASAGAISQATGRTHEQAREVLTRMNPMGRLIHPEDVAALCLFLASPAAASVTGACYRMDGGETV